MTDTRPPRPKAYCLPSTVTIKPVKPKMRPAYWECTIDGMPCSGLKTKAKAYNYLQRRLARATMDDDSLYQELYRGNALVLLYPQHYSLDRDGRHYTDRHERDDFYRADEVDMLFYLEKQRKD